MLFLLIFPVLVAGFVACHVHPVHSYRLHRYEGQYLYLKSAELGLKCFFLALLMALSLHYWLPTNINFFSFTIPLEVTAASVNAMKMMSGAQDDEAHRMAWFVQLSFLTFVATLLPSAWGYLSLRRRFGVWNARVHVIGQILEDSPLDNLLFRLSLQKDKYAMLVMEDRKVYVGKVINLGEPSATTGMDQDISIMPLMSGYRDKDDLKVSFETFYEEVQTDISICLRQDNIVSATEFDFTAYSTWNPAAKQVAKPKGQKKASAPDAKHKPPQQPNTAIKATSQ
jgi:hypothetical protein